MSLSLPQDLVKDDVTLTASTPAEYWNLVNSRGFVPAELTPQQKAANTRRENRRQSEEPDTDKPDEDITAQAGDANQS